MTEERSELVDKGWRLCENDFPDAVENWHGGHEGRSRLVWLYQAAHESPNRDGSKMYFQPHIYLGYCCWPYALKVAEDGAKEWDYGHPFFVGLWANGRAAVTYWRYLDKPDGPLDPIECAHRSGTWAYPNEDEAQILPEDPSFAG